MGEADMAVLAKQLAEIAGEKNVRTDELMAKHTSFRIGGPADIFVTPAGAVSLAGIISFCRERELPVFVMGNGTNLIVRDGGIRGAVVKIRENMSAYELEGEQIVAQPGILLSKLSRIARDNGLSGLEFAEGIPGTLGGAVTMNAGAYDGYMSTVVRESEYLRKDGTSVILNQAEHCFGKRSSFVQSDGGVVLRTRIGLKKGSMEQIKNEMERYNAARRAKQPLDKPSAGSVFKRPEGYFAGKLIQDCGLKGYRIGGAQVSELHAGFIVNTGMATASDVVSLIEHIRNTVLNRFGVELQTEVRIVGTEREGFR